MFAIRSALVGSILFISLLLVAAQGQALSFDASDRGWYDESGLHQPAVTNYFVGQGQGNLPMRNFFVFDLSSVIEPIAAAELQLQLPPTEHGTSFESPQGIETVVFYDFSGSTANLLGGLDGLANYADLGSGVQYGSTQITDADEGLFVNIALNADAIAAINAASGLFVIGGAMTTLDGDGNNNEWAFAMTENSPLSSSRLALTPVPEPTGALLMLAGVAVMQSTCRRLAAR